MSLTRLSIKYFMYMYIVIKRYFLSYLFLVSRPYIKTNLVQKTTSISSLNNNKY